ncbi:extracellular solute-binding protein [Paenibacillus sp. LHD-117]|uniref:ABC transporter substrate-binding protein n=1 Tax=Paenibacillus sp. LHD-117 TaxID=3071412 RepID=UPI0027E13BB1|nr:extracellular solute-binding protein [Paenibacillus sp. LHD-117]MDQ6422388.1 extracellular solute-binding protein [Paenibacillus sp. LHD-117]
MNKRKFTHSIMLLLLIAMLAGCASGNGGGKKEALDPDTPVTLKVAYFNEQAFYQSYGNVFSAKYPNVTFEIIPTMEVSQAEDPSQAMSDLIDAEQPDVVLLTTEQYETLAANGKLYDLDAMVQQTGFDIENIVEGVVQSLRDAGGGKLYGLSPSFNTKALYYNKDLFTKYGVPEPTDNMTWEEVLQLAARFPTDGDDESRIYGFAPSMFDQNPFKLIQNIAAAKGLKYLNADATELTMSEPEWKEIFEAVVGGYEQKSVFMPESSPQGFSMDGMLFQEGRAAMVVDNSMMMVMSGKGMAAGAVTMRAAKSSDGEVKEFEQPEPINMGVVTAPVDASAPDQTSEYELSQIFAVNAASSQADQAWAFIQYVHSDEAAKIRAKTSVGLESRVGYETSANGDDLSPFYKLKPMPKESTEWYPKGFRASFTTIAGEEIGAAASGSKTFDEAFDALVSRGKDALAEANLSGEKERDGEGFGGMVNSIFIGG